MPSTLESLLRQRRKQASVARRRTPADEEHQAQAALIEWASLARLPEAPDVEPGARIADYLFAVPNSGKRSPRAAGRLKAEGMKAGVWDLQLALARGGHPGLWIEMKSSKGTLEPEQKAWGARMERAGYRVHVCRSFDAARAVVAAYVGLRAA